MWYYYMAWAALLRARAIVMISSSGGCTSDGILIQGPPVRRIWSVAAEHGDPRPRAPERNMAWYNNPNSLLL
jgi:hypothetical protein